VKVFVSSTSRDLAEHRAAAIRALRRLGHVVVAMEEFTAATAFPLDQVLKLVRGADAYLVIVAWRYGFVPPTAGIGEKLPPAPAGHPDVSITEWEYLAARERPDRPVLPFLLAESAPWPPSEIDGFDQTVVGARTSSEDVRRFRAVLMRNHIVSFFSRADELEALVGAAIATARLSRGVQINQVKVGQPVQGQVTVPDSSYQGGLLNVVREAQLDQVVTVALQTEWWSTRLYLLAFLLERQTAVRRILVVDEDGFVGLLRPGTVIREIASLHPMVVAFEEKVRERRHREVDVVKEAEALIDLFASTFEDVERSPVEALGPDRPHAREAERRMKVLVTRADLLRWFEDSILTGAIRVNSVDRPLPLDLVRIFDYPGDFVPVIVSQDDAGAAPGGSPAVPRVIDKHALSLQLARAYVTDLLEEST
jgi:hypothetical protein